MIKYISVTVLLIALLHNVTNAQSYFGQLAKQHIEHAKEVHISSNSKHLDYIAFEGGHEIQLDQFVPWLVKHFKLSDNISLSELNRITDDIGQTHIRFRLNMNNIPVHDAMLIAHIKDDKVFAINGKIQSPQESTLPRFFMSEAKALTYAVKHVGAEVYKWELAAEEEFIKELTQDPTASFYPSAKAVFIRHQESKTYRFAYAFDIYAHEPVSRANIYVDAENGEILFVNKLIHTADSVGTAITKYSGSQKITTDLYNNSFRLREANRGLGIETYNLQNSNSYSNATDFIDQDNVWNNVNAQMDEIATDAHWGMEMTYDYFLTKHNRNSLDNNGFKLMSFVHFSTSFANAFWNGRFMTFGDGNSSVGPLVSLDIVAHEISHGLTSNTADLDYQGESGALNESFSDIFGAAIEFFAKPQSANWLMGEDIGTNLRSMSNPNDNGDPDTYLGTYYYTGTADNGGVHTNSGVLNYCFYLMAEGGQGVNDVRDSFDVSGFGIDTAATIAYRTLTSYLTNTSNYHDARFYFIKSAIDLYGTCSPAVKTVTNAFYAVGLGDAYQQGVHANFSAQISAFCAPPAEVNFRNNSQNGASYLWNFGDGKTSSSDNPSHYYYRDGEYDVTLIADGEECGIDTFTIVNFVSIKPSNPCLSKIPSGGNLFISDCKGKLLDSGGEGNYIDNNNGSVTISPLGAKSIRLEFSSFNFEKGFDYLKIYDGNSASSKLIGRFDGRSLPNGGIIIANSGSITIMEETDENSNNSGFEATWECIFPADKPITNFQANDSASCSGVILFNDISLNGPTTWLWDFGDGNTSNERNPEHSYTQNGTYTVSLTTSNQFGTDQHTKSEYINISVPYKPRIPAESVCNNGTASLQIEGGGDFNWYSNKFDHTILQTGNKFTTPNLNKTTTYWVERILQKSVQQVGMTAENTNGRNLNFEQALMFDVYKNVMLKSVKVYAETAGTRNIQLKNQQGQILSAKTVTVTAGWNRVELNFDLPMAKNLKLVGKNLFRTKGGTNYPYTLPGILSITKSSSGSEPLSYYYFFYEWEIQEKSCVSERVAATVYVNDKAPVADFRFTNNDPHIQFNDSTNGAGSCFWNFGDSTNSQLSNPHHTYMKNGTYTVELVVDNGCGVDSTSKTILINLATSIDRLATKEYLNLYPNPNNGSFYVEFEEGESNYQELEIIDMLGNRIYLQQIQPNQPRIEINIEEYSSGFYFLRLISKDHILNKRIIKQ